MCRKLNTAQGAEPFSDFKKQDNYPHITLAMGVFREEEIPAIVREIIQFKPYLPLRFSVT